MKWNKLSNSLLRKVHCIVEQIDKWINFWNTDWNFMLISWWIYHDFYYFFSYRYFTVDIISNHLYFSYTTIWINGGFLKFWIFIYSLSKKNALFFSKWILNGCTARCGWQICFSIILLVFKKIYIKCYTLCKSAVVNQDIMQNMSLEFPSMLKCDIKTLIIHWITILHVIFIIKHPPKLVF